MSISLLTERYAEAIEGVLHCYDRVVLSGHLQEICYAKGMTKYLYQHEIRIFDYGKGFAEPLREAIRAHAQKVADTHGVEIEFIVKKDAFRKEDRIQEIVAKRGKHPGLVHIFSAMEGCQAYRPWHDKKSGKSFVKSVKKKCLHYYFYFIDEDLGLCYLRVPTWSPFRLQFYFNGHQALAQRLQEAGIGFEMADNAFIQIENYEQANELAQFDVEMLHQKLDIYARQFCPVLERLDMTYHWSIMQAEYATDIIFRSPETLEAMFPHLLEILIQAVKPADVATFLGRKLHGNYQGEMGNRFNKRWLGRRLKHRMGPVTIKMYDKFNRVLRIETTVNKVSFFKQYRKAHHRDGSTTTEYAPMKRTIYSLSPLAETLQTVNQRYLKYISAFETPEAGVHKLQRLAETVHDDYHRYKGFNLLSEEDASLFRLLLSGEFVIYGFSNKALRTRLGNKTSAQIKRLLKRLRKHGLIKRVSHCYRYYLTDFGRQAAALALKLRTLVIIPTLASPLPTSA